MFSFTAMFPIVSKVTMVHLRGSWWHLHNKTSTGMSLPYSLYADLAANMIPMRLFLS